LAVLIVAYKAAEKLDGCLRALEAHLPGHAIYIWDNSGPHANEMRELARRHPHTHWHFSNTNVGFATAVNRLADAVPDHDLLLVNPDAEITSAISGTRAAVQSDCVAAAAPLAWLPDTTETAPPLFARRSMSWDVGHRKLTLVRALVIATGLGDRLRGTWFSHLYRRQPREVDGFLTGACLAINRQAWDSIGPFDEEFFLYGEEVEWQRRAVASGWRLQLAGETGVRHLAMGTVLDQPDSLSRSRDLYRAGTALLVERCFGIISAELFMAISAASDWLRLSLRRTSRAAIAQPDIVVTVAGPDHVVNQRTSLARALSAAGLSVAVISLQPLGVLPRDLPASIRLVRCAWWSPALVPQRIPKTLVVGSSREERRFRRLLRLRSKRTFISPSDARTKYSVVEDGPNSSERIH